MISITPCDECGRDPPAGRSTVDRLTARAERNYEKFGKKKAYAVTTGSCYYCENGVYSIRSDVRIGRSSWHMDVDI